MFLQIMNLISIISDLIRYINTVLQYARNNPQIIMLLNIKADVQAVKDVDVLVVKEEPKSKLTLERRRL